MSDTLLPFLIDYAKKHGADESQATEIKSRSLSVNQRWGVMEKIESSESHAVTLRVFIGKKHASLSSSMLDKTHLISQIEDAIARARLSPEDPFTHLSDASQWNASSIDLDLFDKNEPSLEALQEKVKIAEAAARTYPLISNSEGVEAAYSYNDYSLATSKGFHKNYASSYHTLSASFVAGEEENRETDYEYSVKRHATDLVSPSKLGKAAAERVIKRLGSKKIATCQSGIILDKRVASSLLGSFASAINGTAIASKSSFLKDMMHEEIFGKDITIIDDPLRARGLGSQTYDGEGVGTSPRTIIENGTLKSWILDIRTANQLGMKTTGHASFGFGSSPSPSNLYMKPGEKSVSALMQDMKTGLYVTDSFSTGINLITGDYSVGASGFWIENGVIAFPVSGITIAGQLRTMFKSLRPANDLDYARSINAPSLLIENMTIAGL